MYDSVENIMLMFLLVYFLIVGGMLIAALASYILRGIGMYTLGRKRGLNNPWLAFIPYARTYFQGELCGTLTFKNHKLPSPGIWLIVFPVISSIGAGILMLLLWSGFIMNAIGMYDVFNYSYDVSYMIGQLFSFGDGLLVVVLIGLYVLSVGTAIAQKTLLVLVNQQIFGRHTDKNYAIMHAVFGVFVPLYTSIYFFIIRNRE